MRIKKLLAVGLSIALVFSMSACSMGNKTTYLTLSDEMSALENTQFKGSLSAELDDIENNEFGIEKVTLDLEGKSVKGDGMDLDFDLSAGDFDLKGDLIVKGDKGYVSTETALSVIGSIIKLFGASDEDVKMLVDELKKEIGAEYIEAPLEMGDTDLSKVSFARTLKALDALTKSYKSTILSSEGNVYKLTLTKETIKSETGAIQSAVEKTPKKILPLLADLLDAFAADVEALGDEALGDEDGKLAELKEDAKELREIVNSKEKMKEFKESLKDEGEDSLFSVFSEDLDKFDKFEIISTIEKKDGGYVTTVTYHTKNADGDIKFEMDFAVQGISDVKIEAPKDVASSDDLEDLGLGLGGSSSKKDKDDDKEVTRPVEDDEEEEAEKPAKKPVEEDEKEEKKPAKKPSSKNGDVLDTITTALSDSDVKDFVDGTASNLGGTWSKDDYTGDDGYYSYSAEKEFGDSSYIEVGLSHSGSDYNSFEVSIYYDKPDVKEAAKLFEDTAKKLFGKDIFTDSIKEALDSAVDADDVESSAPVEIDGIPVNISVKFENDEDDPDFSGGWFSIDVFASLD